MVVLGLLSHASPHESFWIRNGSSLLLAAVTTQRGCTVLGCLESLCSMRVHEIVMGVGVGCNDGVRVE